MNSFKNVFFLFCLATLVSFSASATAISGAIYNIDSGILYLQVDFNGGLKAHEFSLEWDSCQIIDGQKQISARLLDTGWDDTGHEEISQLINFDLSNLECKPALLTVRSGKHSHITIEIQ